MPSNLQIDQALSASAQSLKDQDGNVSQLTLATDKVGIGTTNPAAALDVQGEIRSSGSKGGSLNAFNPNNQEANVYIGWGEDVARIRIGGEGAGSRNGLDIQTVRNRSLMRITGEGKVGIGTTTPTEALEVNGTITATGDIQLAGADCAEEFNIESEQLLEPGTALVIGNEETLCQCTEAYDRKVAGVISGAGDCKPGIILGRQSFSSKRMPLALTGKVYCKVDAQYAPINIGDLLTTSPTPGHAMKAQDLSKASGAILGKALRPLAQGQGLIPILVTLQ